MSRHGSGGNLLLVFAEEQPLPPVEEVAAVACAKQVEHHRHRPETEGGGQQKVLRAADNLARHGVELCLRAEAVGIVHEEEVHRPHPVEHTAEQSEQGLLRISLDKDTRNDQSQSEGSHSHSRIKLFYSRSAVFQHTGKNMRKGHRCQCHRNGHDRFAPIPADFLAPLYQR